MDESRERIVQEVLQRVLEMRREALAASGSRPAPDEKPVLVVTEDAGSAIACMKEELHLGQTSFALFKPADNGAAPPGGFTRVYGAAEADRLKAEVAQRFSEVRLVRVTLPAIARLAHLVVSDPVSDLALAALSARVPVFLEPIRGRPEYLNLTHPLRSEFDTLVRKLREFGVKELSSARRHGAPHSGRPPGTNPSRPGGPVPGSGRVRRTGRILTVNDVQDLMDAERRELVLASGSRLTDLAREYVEKHGIAVRTQG